MNEKEIREIVLQFYKNGGSDGFDFVINTLRSIVNKHGHAKVSTEEVLLNMQSMKSKFIEASSGNLILDRINKEVSEIENRSKIITKH